MKAVPQDLYNPLYQGPGNQVSSIASVLQTLTGDLQEYAPDFFPDTRDALASTADNIRLCNQIAQGRDFVANNWGWFLAGALVILLMRR